MTPEERKIEDSRSKIERPSSSHHVQSSNFKLRTSSATWVFPNRNTIGLAAVLVGMWWAGVSQSNGAAYLLCFVLGAVAAVSTVHAWANLQGVEIEADPIRPVFAGEELKVPLHASSTRCRERFAIRVAAVTQETSVMFATLPREGSVAAELHVGAPQRGAFTHLPVRLVTRFPLGFFTARRTVRLGAAHCVYPAPVGSRSLPVSLAPARSATDGARTEGDDFGGVRAWRVGESQRHIDWKAAARGQPLLIKQWSGDADTTLVLDWDDLHDLAPEARLSQLASWVIQAERGGIQYGLRLPGVSLPPARGEAQYHACLRELAQFPADQTESARA